MDALRLAFYLWLLPPALLWQQPRASFPRPETASYELPPPCPAYDSLADARILDSLKARFGRHKVLPEGFESAALRALSHYPELENVPVAFIFRKNPVAHTSRPHHGSLLRSKKHRRYLVIISTEVSELLAPGRLPHLSYNAQIGVLGHELAHTLDYLHRRFFNLVGVGIRYSSSKKFAQQVERSTDSTAIRHHLGFQLLAWSTEAHHILEQAGRGQNYLTPAEIREAMDAIGD